MTIDHRQLTIDHFFILSFRKWSIVNCRWSWSSEVPRLPLRIHVFLGDGGLLDVIQLWESGLEVLVPFHLNLALIGPFPVSAIDRVHNFHS